MVDDWCPENWKIVRLRDLGEVGRGRSRHRPRYAPHLYSGIYPFIQTGDIKASGGKITTYQQTYSEAGLAQSKLWNAGTICITIAANIAETAILTFPACFPDSVVGFVADKSKCDVFFVEYMFRYLKRKIQHQATGSVQDNINLGTLELLSFPIPRLSEQKAIARILSSLDDKIELNQQMNRTLEAQARAIFKSWFVDFDPVRAKMEGRQPAGMDAATAALFPDAFEESPLGMHPLGWNVGVFNDLIDILSGGTPNTSISQYWDGNIPWFSIKDTPREVDVFVLSTEKRITKLGLKNSSTQILPQGTTIISARGTVGKLALVGIEMAMNQSGFGIKGIKGYSDFYIYYKLKYLIYDLQQKTHGSVFDTINRETFKAIKCNFPPVAIAQKFDDKTINLMANLKNNLYENQTLATLRDTLLPKLMSGEIRVKEAEKMVREAA